MSMLRMAIVAGCVVALSSVAALAAPNSFRLQVNDVSGLESPWPLIGGLPFPEGELRDPARIRVVNGAGEQVPAQIDVTTTWHDGSIRWALVGINASAQDEYRVEYGPNVSRSAPEHPLSLQQADDGALTVDTHAAVYEFTADRLLPETARMGQTVLLDGSGDGAYLIDNRGRLARVAGADADIDTQVLKRGPMRTVVRRAGWYVTADGERVARAKVWFYFTAGSPFVRITHSLVFTEDTNELWMRDYGLQFRAPATPVEAVFAKSKATWTDRYIGGRGPEEAQKRQAMAEMFSTRLADREQTLMPVPLDGDEVYMLQENYPHVLEREFRAVVARAHSPLITDSGAVDSDNLWVHPWVEQFNVAGDWAEARYADHALAVVMPQLAQRFPKEIAVSPSGARVSFWSGRSGRELDFRAATLVNEYWKRWANNAKHRYPSSNLDRGPAIGTRIARRSSNALGAARTHDVWLMPRTSHVPDAQLKARARAAAHPPLLQADPAWLGASGALLGWPMHPRDTGRFPKVEEQLADEWEEILGNRYGNAELRRTGFYMWGKNVTLGTGPRWFRLSQGKGHYKLDLNAWLLYARSGERRYYDYGRHFTRFAGDLSVHHWTAGDRFRGGFSSSDVHFPFYWHGSSKLVGSLWTPGWLMQYRLTGDEYANELLNMVADAYRERADPSEALTGYTHGHVYNLSILYDHTRDEKIRQLARKAAHTLIDLDNPTGLNDDLRYGVYYKISTEWLFPLYLYYVATDDETARRAILQGLDDKFRFNHVQDWTHTPHGRGPSSSQTFRLFLFSEAHRWTGNPAYLRLVRFMVDHPHFSLMGHNYLLGAPVAMRALANADQPIGPFPILSATRNPDNHLRGDFRFIETGKLPTIRVRKSAGAPVQLSIYIRMPNGMDENAPPNPVVRRAAANSDGGGLENVRIEKEQMFKTRNRGRQDPRRWHVYLTLPQEAAAGRYTIELPDASTFSVLESSAEAIGFGDEPG